MADPFPRLTAAAVDGRAHSVTYLQNQLRKLHVKLLVEQDALKQAMIADTNCSNLEADLEFTSSMLELKQHYDSTDLKTVLESSNSIQAGKDNAERRVASGVVYIIPTGHTLLYSVLAPLTAAMVAGNCVVVELPDTTRRLGSVLKKILIDLLEPDTFAISSSRPSKQYMDNVLCLLQEEETNPKEMPSSHILASRSGAQAVAVITRNADIEGAARTLTNACLMFNGRSPYSPDIIFVDEFEADRFMSATIKHMSQIATLRNGEDMFRGKIAGASIKRDSKVLDDPSVRLVASGASGTIVEILDRSSSLLRNKNRSPVLMIHRISSMDDAIDFINGGEGVCALTVFATLSEANYLSNFVDARAAYVNHFPFELLLGPMSPLGYPTQLSPRYSCSMFSDPRPQRITKTNITKLLDSMVVNNQMRTSRELTDLVNVISEPTKRPEGGTVDFFLQGLMTGTVAAVFSALVLATAAGKYAIPYLKASMSHIKRG